MKSIRILAGAAAALGLFASAAGAAGPGSSAISGSYVEARNANVFVGDCHFGSEYQTLGRNAILAWHVGSGARQGVSLAGLNVAAAVAADNNLAEASAHRTSVLFVDSRASAAQAAALVSLAKELGGASLGTVHAVHHSAVHFTSAGDAFQVSVPGAISLDANRLPDRACCIMPYRVWYHPLTPVQHPIVGSTLKNRYSGHDLPADWSYEGQNSAFIGDFSTAS